jgi:hypothetical protein
LFFSGTGSPTIPSAGDIFHLKILKPFTRGDIYEFVALPTGLVAVRPTMFPLEFRLDQNYPNPFNPKTEIRYGIGPARLGGDGQAGGEGVLVLLNVYDLLGREVATLVNEWKAAGAHTVRFDGSGLASGVYVYRLTAGGYVASRKMLMIR